MSRASTRIRQLADRLSADDSILKGERCVIMKQWYEELFKNYGNKYDEEIFTQGTIGECDFIEKEIKNANNRLEGAWYRAASLCGTKPLSLSVRQTNIILRLNMRMYHESKITSFILSTELIGTFY